MKVEIQIQGKLAFFFHFCFCVKKGNIEGYWKRNASKDPLNSTSTRNPSCVKFYAYTRINRCFQFTDIFISYKQRTFVGSFVNYFREPNVICYDSIGIASRWSLFAPYFESSQLIGAISSVSCIKTSLWYQTTFSLGHMEGSIVQRDISLWIWVMKTYNLCSAHTFR